MFKCECDCITWNITDKTIKCINPLCKNKYNLNDIEDSNFFNLNRKLFLLPPETEIVERVIYGSKN
jgi:hypothetical protein